MIAPPLQVRCAQQQNHPQRKQFQWVRGKRHWIEIVSFRFKLENEIREIPVDAEFLTTYPNRRSHRIKPTNPKACHSDFKRESETQ
jgi:hypothetical protein